MLHLVHCFRFPYCATLTSPVSRAMSTFTLDSKRMTALRRLRDWISSNDSPLKPAFGDNASDVSNAFATTHEPATGLSLVYFRQTSTKELDNIVSNAARAQQTWCCLAPLERSKLLHTVASLVRDEAEWLAELEVLDTGKPLWEAKADIDACADSIDLFAGFIPSLSGSHVTVPPNPSSSIFDAFTVKLMESMKRLQVDDPFLPDTSMGALITPEHLQKVLDYISGAVAEGATQLYGGTRPEFPEGSYLARGNFLLPCILTNCNDQMKVVREEVFGPVITLLHFDDEDEVIRRANHSKLGLAGGVFTKDLATAHRIAAQLQCGSVYVNSFNYYPPGIPFGGYKQSGFGRENSFDSVLAHTQLKAVYIEGGKLPEPFPLS
ncbi:Betaine-aldehyde dehydrogenase [Fasciola hepatica]|uniref:Betaine-aldehyde dehydrogenase n=1 Tax=Fasciola hepatica TaxID=6192 RepID=A0A4E0R6S7_FASHE|nr:Betaine-aldehyde dehydrogenase [Fasciola hepatica]